jgi:hypothetical protein
MELYKYVSSAAAERFFRKGMVRFTQPADFNDPFELRPHIRGLADHGTIAKQHSIAFEDESIENQLRLALDKLQLSPSERSRIDLTTAKKNIWNHAHQAFEFVRNISDGLGPALSRQMNNTFNDQLGIFCLTEDPLNLLMWAHYGDHHRGVVIEFDAANPFFNRTKGPQDDFRHFRKINYTDNRPSVFLTLSDAIEVFYSKSREWEYEREWRLIAPLNDATIRIENSGGYPVALFEVPSDAVRSVIMGSRVGPEKSLELGRLLRSDAAFQNVRIDRVELDESRFALHRIAVPVELVDRWLAAADYRMRSSGSDSYRGAQ